MRLKFQKFVYMETDLPYMEMRANFNLIFLKTLYGNYLRPQSTLKKLKM